MSKSFEKNELKEKRLVLLKKMTENKHTGEQKKNGKFSKIREHFDQNLYSFRKS
jgi:hypothetical protein